MNFICRWLQQCRTMIQNVLNGSQNLCLRYWRLRFSFNTSIWLESIPKSERATELDTSSEMVYMGFGQSLCVIFTAIVKHFFTRQVHIPSRRFASRHVHRNTAFQAVHYKNCIKKRIYWAAATGPGASWAPLTCDLGCRLFLRIRTF